MPQSTGESLTYLQSQQIKVDAILQSPLAKLQVSGTPTLILADSDGKVIRSWVGKVPLDTEAEIISKL